MGFEQRIVLFRKQLVGERRVLMQNRLERTGERVLVGGAAQFAVVSSRVRIARGQERAAVEAFLLAVAILPAKR